MVLSVLSYFSSSRARVEPLNRFSRFMAETILSPRKEMPFGVRTIDDALWGKYAPTKMGVNRQFLATEIYKSQCLRNY